MRILFLFATAYILIAAVACQPLREAAAELEVSRKAYRKPRQPPKPPRHSTPKAKRRIEGISAASEAISDLFSRFRSRGGRLARKAAADAAQPGIDSYTRLKQRPLATLDGLTDPSRPESRFKPRIKPFRFKGDEAGYVADADHNSLAAKPYKRPPLSAKLSTQAEAAGGQLQVDHTTASASEPNGQPAKHDGLFTDPKMAPYVAGVSVFSVIASWLLARTISQNTQQTDALNQATASSSANQQAVMQRAASVDAARQASGSGRTEIRRRDLFAGDQAQQAADDSVRKRSVFPIIKSERAADNEGQRETLSKRIDPLQIMSSAAERTRTSIGSSASSFREALREYADDRRQFVGPLVALVLSALGLIGAIVYYEVKSEEISNELAANSTDRAGPSTSPPVLRLMNIEPLDEPSPVEDPENEQHSTKLRKRWNPVSAIRDCWQGTTIEDGRRVADEVVQNAPQSAKMLAVKYLTGVLAFFSVSAALLYYGYRGKSDSNSNSNSDPMPMPEPDNSKQPTVPSIPASEHRSSSQIRHTLLKKRSLVVDSTVPVLLPIAGAESSDRASKIDEEKTSQQSTSPHDQAEEEDEINSKGSSRRFLDALQSQDLHKRMVRFPQVHRTTRTLADAGETAHEVSPKVYAALAVLSLLLVGSGVGAWAYHEYGDWHLDHTSLHKRSLNDEAEFGDATPVDHSNVEGDHSKKLAQTLSKRDVINKMIRRPLMGGKKAHELAPRALKAAGTESNVAEIVPVSEIDSAEADHGVRAFDSTDIHIEAGYFKTSPTSSRSSASADDVKYARQHSKRVAGATLCASVLAAGGFDAVKNVVKHARKPGPDSSSSKSPVLLQVNKPVLNKQGNQDMQKRMIPMGLSHYWGLEVEHGTEALAEEVDEGTKAVLVGTLSLAGAVALGIPTFLWYRSRKRHAHDNHGPIHKRSTRMVDKRDLDALPPKSLQERAGFDGIEAGAREVSADIHIHRPEQSRTKEHQPAVVIHECDIDRESIQALAHWIRAAHKEASWQSQVDEPGHARGEHFSKCANLAPVFETEVEKDIAALRRPLTQQEQMKLAKEVVIGTTTTASAIATICIIADALRKKADRRERARENQSPLHKRGALQEYSEGILKRALENLEMEGPTEEGVRLLNLPVRAGLEHELHLGVRRLDLPGVSRVYHNTMLASLVVVSAAVHGGLIWLLLRAAERHTAAQRAAKKQAEEARGMYRDNALHKREVIQSSQVLSERDEVSPVASSIFNAAAEVEENPRVERMREELRDRCLIVAGLSAVALFFLGSISAVGYIAYRAYKQDEAARKNADSTTKHADSLLSRAPRHLSKRMISRNALNLAIADFKSLASKAQLTPAEQQARKHRLRKYGVFVGALAALDGVKTLVLYQVIKDYKENKRIRQQLQQVKQQQQQFSGYDGVRDSHAGHILSKRAKIAPLDEITVSAAAEIDHNPPYELWKQRVIDKMTMVGLAVGVSLTTFALGFEGGYGIYKLVGKKGKKPNQSGKSLSGPVGKRDLALEKQEQGSKREVKAESVPMADNTRSLAATERHRLNKRSSPPLSDGIPTGAIVMRFLRQVAVDSRRSGLISPPNIGRWQSGSDDSDSRSRASIPLPLFLPADVAKSLVWQQNIREMQRELAEDRRRNRGDHDANGGQQREDHQQQRQQQQLVRRSQSSRLSAVAVDTLHALKQNKVKRALDAEWREGQYPSMLFVPRRPRSILSEAKVDDGLYGEGLVEGRGGAELDAQEQRLAKRTYYPNQGRLPIALMLAAVVVVAEGYKKYRDYRSRPRVHYFAPTQPTGTTRQRPRSESPFSAVK